MLKRKVAHLSLSCLSDGVTRMIVQSSWIKWIEEGKEPSIVVFIPETSNRVSFQMKGKEEGRMKMKGHEWEGRRIWSHFLLLFHSVYTTFVARCVTRSSFLIPIPLIPTKNSFSESKFILILNLTNHFSFLLSLQPNSVQWTLTNQPAKYFPIPPFIPYSFSLPLFDFSIYSSFSVLST